MRDNMVVVWTPGSWCRPSRPCRQSSPEVENILSLVNRPKYYKNIVESQRIINFIRGPQLRETHTLILLGRREKSYTSESPLLTAAEKSPVSWLCF